MIAYTELLSWDVEGFYLLIEYTSSSLSKNSLTQIEKYRSELVQRICSAVDQDEVLNAGGAEGLDHLCL